MFEPFGEMKMKQSLKNVKDFSIGIGLSCSKVLTDTLLGQIEILEDENISL
jgi:hypothetical protein